MAEIASINQENALSEGNIILAIDLKKNNATFPGEH